MSTKTNAAINIRYSNLAEESCCLSCGGALNHAKAAEGEICGDLGSGRGLDVIRLAQAVGSEGYTYGVDISEGMIQKARRNIEKFDIKNASIIQSRLEKLPFKTGELDLLISNCTINHAEDKNAVWKEIHRSLKAGGRFVVSDIYSMDPVPEEYRTDPEAIAECWAGSVTREEYLEQLSAAGFDNLEVMEESSPYEKGKIQCVSWTIRAYKS
jgi:arsenite methyltransferase